MILSSNGSKFFDHLQDQGGCVLNLVRDVKQYPFATAVEFFDERSYSAPPSHSQRTPPT